MRFQVQHIQTLASTNAYLKQILKEDKAAEGTVILADFQTEGKGRGRNSWFSDPGKNLLMSILFYPDLEADHHFIITEFISLALVESLRRVSVEAKIKWPNDIYIEDRKVAGLLIENAITGNCIHSSIVGFGLNLNQEKFPADLPNPVSVKNSVGFDINRDEFIEELFCLINTHYQLLRKRHFTELHVAYNENLYKKGEIIRYVLDEDIVLEGAIKRVDTSGSLIIEDERGERAYLFSEIKILV